MTLSKCAHQFQEFVRQQGLALRAQELPDSTRPAYEAARALGRAREQIVKSPVPLRDELLVDPVGPARQHDYGPAGRPFAELTGILPEHTALSIK
ncbi:hypothetical protein [Streptomyces sp. RKAG290]|uniref:hypothetical protein n=1 Tax=Streptomyces sp. RKAG290 TaxID=2888348 RepID=UPI0020331F64|nr:hypothetical protein [Streptomyces sp. RKAG290]MCM2416304.1 hypothetical protein [Streptomyces sp. RKAG290]